MAYVWMALILGIVWFVMSIRGFYAKDDVIWAKKYFIYSIIYLTLMFVGMIVITI
jgi:protoheme IX farnesyltransferase